MPSKNIQKIDVDETYYHIYNRGVARQPIFKDEDDYRVFFSLLKRYLSKDVQLDLSKREYPNYSKDIELLAVCLMPNHFHLLCYQTKQGAMTKLLRSVGTSYTMYFNKRHKRVGHLFQDRYKASMINDDAYLMHITRYIHLNPPDSNWEFTSMPYYLGNQQAEWLKPERILQLFEGKDNYLQFLNDHDDYQQSLEAIEEELGGQV